MLAIGCDHAGFALAQKILEHLAAQGIEVEFYGSKAGESVDYPLVGRTVAQAVAAGRHKRAILVCGTGIGISVAANKIPGIRAANCENSFSARMAREHNNAQILCMGGRVVGPSIALEMVDAFLSSEFQQDRHTARVKMIEEAPDA